MGTRRTEMTADTVTCSHVAEYIAVIDWQDAAAIRLGNGSLVWDDGCRTGARDFARYWDAVRRAAGDLADWGPVADDDTWTVDTAIVAYIADNDLCVMEHTTAEVDDPGLIATGPATDVALRRAAGPALVGRHWRPVILPREL
jgi:hypothetical protein